MRNPKADAPEVLHDTPRGSIIYFGTTLHLWGQWEGWGFRPRYLPPAAHPLSTALCDSGLVYIAVGLSRPRENVVLAKKVRALWKLEEERRGGQLWAVHVRGHLRHAWNERADRAAARGAAGFVRPRRICLHREHTPGTREASQRANRNRVSKRRPRLGGRCAARGAKGVP